MLEAHLLGSFRILRAGHIMEISSRPAQALLAYLLLNPGRPLRREKLAGLIWPEADEANARSNLRHALWRIRKALEVEGGPTYLETDDLGVSLRLQPGDWLDVAVLEGAKRDAGPLAVMPNQPAELEDLLRPVLAYGGELLPGFYEEWVVLERQWLQAIYEDRLQRLLVELLRQKLWSEAAVWSEKWIASGGAPEPAYRALMLACAAQGNQAGMSAAYQRCREALRRELAVEPAEQTLFLYNRLAAGASSVDIARLAYTAALRTSAPLPSSASLAPAALGQDDLSGRSLHGYILGERIGEGGYGAVYRAIQPVVEREVAVKIILPQYANSPGFIRRFEDEARIIARLEHPHIVPLYDYWREPGAAYLVMRLLRGGSLHERLSAGPLAPETCLQLLDQVGSALHAAHRLGVVHRDLKPANILLDEDGNAYLADFGIARFLEDPDDPAQAGVLVGSSAYISPEQIRSEVVRPQSDIYCLGLLLYEMLTGQMPFHGTTPDDFIQQHLSQPLPPLNLANPALPAALDSVLQRATAKDPAARYPDVPALQAGVHAALIGGIEFGAAPTLPETAEASAIMNPYKGLRAFSEADSGDFFGREELVHTLLGWMAEVGELSGFLAVIGPSGSGKSSVVRAGLIPALRGGGLPGSQNWFITHMLPGAHPLEELEAALLRVAVNPPASLLEQLQADERGLLRAVLRILPEAEHSCLVLVIDQFEELFTLVDDEAERLHFLQSLLAAVLDPHRRLRLVVTLRADFTDRPLQYADFGELVRQRSEFVLPLSPDGLEQAVSGPARRAGLTVESRLVRRIVREIGDQPGSLPLLQYALTELFERRQGRRLTLAAYQQAGGVAGALARRAEEIYAGLGAPEHEAARQLFLRLVTLGEGAEDTRRRVLRAEVEALAGYEGGGRATFERVIEAYGRYRLLTFDHDPRTRGPTIEVAHEALLREWPRLRAWLSENRADVRQQRLLAAAAAEWQTAGRDDSFLLSGARLERFEGWAQDSPLALTQVERELLQASIAERRRMAAAEAERQRRELEAARKLAEAEAARAEDAAQAAARLRSRNRLILGAGAIALLLAVLAGAFGLLSYRNLGATRAANAQVLLERANAEQEALVASVRELAGQANLNLDIDPERSILLALRAVKLMEAAGQPPLLEAQDALHRAVQAARTLLTLQGHSGELTSVAYSPNGSLLATGADDNTVKIWDARQGKELLSLPVGKIALNTYRSLGFSPDSTRLAASIGGNQARVWDAVTGKELLTLSGHTGEVVAARFSPDGRLLVTASQDGNAMLWNAADGMKLRTFSGHSQPLTDVVFSPDGRLLATTSADKTAILWDIASGRALLTLAHPDAVNSAAFSPDGSQLLTGASDTAWRLWDTTTGQNQITIFGHASLVTSVAFDPNGERLATASEDGTVKLWDRVTGRELLTLSGHTGGVTSLAFSPDGAQIASASRDQTARVWDISAHARSERANLVGHTNRVMEAIYSPDGKTIATAGMDSSVRLWDAATGQLLYNLGGYTNGVWSVSFSPDSKSVAATGITPDAAVRIWDVATGQELKTIVTDSSTVRFSPDGKHLAISTEAGNIRILETATGRETLALAGQNDFIQGLAYNPDGTRLASATENGMVRVWDTVSGEVTLTLTNTVTQSNLAFSPDGRLLATTGNDALVRVWEVATGAELYTFSGHTGSTRGVSFSPDGRYLASAGVDRTVKLWDLHAPSAPPLNLYGHDRAIYTVDFSPDGKSLLTASRDGTARIYAVDINDLARIALSRLTRTFTLQECQTYLHLEACPEQ